MIDKRRRVTKKEGGMRGGYGEKHKKENRRSAYM